MRLAAISMIRDEADIIAPFLRHLAAFFDIAFLLDQRSSDGTSELMREACTGRAGWSYHFMDFAGRHQKEVITHFMSDAFERGADALFLIDSDEFVAFCDKASLVEAMSNAIKAAAPLAFRLRPCVPTRFDRWHFDPGEALWIGRGDDAARHPGPTIKIAIPRSLFEREPGMRITQGNHAAVSAEGKILPANFLGYFYHVPLRSREQFLQKVLLAAVSNFAKHNPMTRESIHKRHLLEAIGQCELSDAVMATIAAQYPPTKGIVWWDSPFDLEQRGFVLDRLETSFADIPLRELPRPALPQVVARSLAAFASENVEDGSGSLVFESAVVRFQQAANPSAPGWVKPQPAPQPDGPNVRPVAPPGIRPQSIRRMRRRLAKLERRAIPRWHLRVTLAAAILAVAALIVAIVV